jgi:hypothetical protein
VGSGSAAGDAARFVETRGGLFQVSEKFEKDVSAMFLYVGISVVLQWRGGGDNC